MVAYMLWLVTMSCGAELPSRPRVIKAVAEHRYSAQIIMADDHGWMVTI